MHLLYLVLEVTGCHRLSGQLLSHRTLVPKILQTLEIKGKLYVAPQNDHNFLIFIFLDRCTYQCISFFSNLITMHDLIPLKTPNNMKSMLSCCDVSRNPCELDVDSTGEQFFSKPRGTYVFFPIANLSGPVIPTPKFFPFVDFLKVSLLHLPCLEMVFTWQTKTDFDSCSAQNLKI